jgi:hypothetical protein
MRYAALLLAGLVLAAPAAAATPRFGVFNLDSDLARASRNEFGDVKVAEHKAALRGIVVRCAAGCRLGSGWLAFARPANLQAGDVSAARAHSGRIGWSVEVTLTARGRTRWTSFSRQAARHLRTNGVPDVLAVVVDGSILAAPFANDVRARHGTLELVGFRRADALRAATLLRK